MATLRVRDRGAGPVIYGRWRGGTSPVERPIGRGWLVADGAAGGKPNGRVIGKWRDRRGRPPEGFLDVQAATQELAVVQAEWRAEQADLERSRLRADTEPLTLAELAERFLAWGEEDDPHTDREGWKNSHARNTATYVARIVREFGAECYANEITINDLHEFMAQLVPTRNGQPTGAKPTRKFLSNYALPLKGMFAMAHRNGWVEDDQAALLPSYKPKRKRAADPMRRDEYLTPEEVLGVTGQLENPQDRAMVLIMSMAGLRPGETVALRWQDVDLATATLRVIESRTMGVTGTPKSDAGRSLPVPQEVADALSIVAERGVLTAQADLVFLGRTGGHVDIDALRSRFNIAQDTAGISPRRELRQLRNTFGTVMAAAGAPLRTIQAWMGHENLVTTERYASHMPRTKDAAMISAAFSVERTGD